MSLCLLLLPTKLMCLFLEFRATGKTSIGDKAFIHPSVQILGRANVRLGNNSVLSQDGWLNVNHRDEIDFVIDIGDHCFLGRRNFFSSGKAIVIGHYVLTANDCHFLGSSHVASDPTRPCITTGTTNADTIVVGHNTFIGAGARIVGHVTIGHGCIVGACALVTRDVPPFSQVVGFPATVRRRYSFPRGAWVDLALFTAADEEALPTAVDFLTLLRSRPIPEMPYLAAGSDMGQC